MIRSYASLLFWLGLTISASVMLYRTSDHVNALDRQLRSLNMQIEAEQESLHVLKAEWVYLTNPARIKTEANRHLALQPTAPRRVVAAQNLADLLPFRDGTRPAPRLMAQTVPAPMPVKVATAPRNKHDRIVAALNAGRINDHVTLQPKNNAASVVGAGADKIGALIGSLGLRP